MLLNILIILVTKTWSQEVVPVNSVCFAKEEIIAGTPRGTEYSDMEKLNEIMTTDMRLWGFQVCEDRGTGILSSFRLETAKDYGRGSYIDMTAIGPGTSNCRRFKIEDPVRDVISSIELHLSEVVLGFTIQVGQKQG